MAVICREHNLLFIQNPRTASSTIGRFLVKHCGGEFVPRDDEKAWGFRKHASLEDIEQSRQVDPQHMAACLSFGAVRNPFDSIASLYQKMLNDSRLPLKKQRRRWWWNRTKRRRQVKYAARHTFDEFVERFVASESHPNLTGRLDGVQVVLRFERISHGLFDVLSRAGLEVDRDLPTRNATSNKTAYRDYYSERSRVVVETTYRDVLDQYEYSF